MKDVAPHRSATVDQLSRYLRKAGRCLFVPPALLISLSLTGCTDQDLGAPGGTKNQVLLDHMYNPDHPSRPHAGKH